MTARRQHQTEAERTGKWGETATFQVAEPAMCGAGSCRQLLSTTLETVAGVDTHRETKLTPGMYSPGTQDQLLGSMRCPTSWSQVMDSITSMPSADHTPVKLP